MNLNLDEIIGLTGIHPKRVHAVYLYGSQVYGTNSETSDYDIVVIAATMNPDIEIREGLLNIHVKTPDQFKDALYKHEMWAFECIFAPEFAKLKEKKPWEFKFFQERLVKKAVKTASDSWFKARKRMEDGDYYRGKKSAFHAVRILNFAHQIKTKGKITDFGASNKVWEEIKDFEEPLWKEIRDIAIKRKGLFEMKLEGKKKVAKRSKKVVRKKKKTPFDGSTFGGFGASKVLAQLLKDKKDKNINSIIGRNYGYYTSELKALRTMKAEASLAHRIAKSRCQFYKQFILEKYGEDDIIATHFANVVETHYKKFVKDYSQ